MERPRTIAVLALLAAACGPPALETIPPEIQGRWTTRAPTHSDRFLQLGESNLTLGTGGRKFEIRAVVRVEPGETLHGRQAFRIFYEDDTGHASLLVRYAADPTPSLYLGHRAEPWTRSGSPR